MEIKLLISASLKAKRTVVDMSGFRGKVALITGSSSGIGLLTALQLAKRGANVMLTGRNEEALKEAVTKCKEQGLKDSQVGYVVADLLLEESPKKIADALFKKFGTLHILINNAGLAYKDDGPVLKVKHTKAFDIHYQLAVKAPWLLIGLVVDELCKNKGCIINLSSLTSSIAGPGNTGYGSMKAAADHMSKCLAVELGPHGVRVNTVKPGMTGTAFISKGYNISPEQEHSLLNSMAQKTVPLGGAVNTTEQVADVIVFLASDEAARISGVCLPIDGAMTLSHPVYDFAKK